MEIKKLEVDNLQNNGQGQEAETAMEMIQGLDFKAIKVDNGILEFQNSAKIQKL